MRCVRHAHESQGSKVRDDRHGPTGGHGGAARSQRAAGGPVLADAARSAPPRTRGTGIAQRKHSLTSFAACIVQN